MRVHQIPLLLLCTGLLVACYGTKVGPPLQSSTAPPGMSGVPPGPDTLTLPADLPGLLQVYRQSLIKQSHHLPAAIADGYAEAQIKSLSRQYSGREQDLKAEIARRLQPGVAPGPRSGRPTPSAYPVDALSATDGAVK